MDTFEYYEAWETPNLSDQQIHVSQANTEYRAMQLVWAKSSLKRPVIMVQKVTLSFSDTGELISHHSATTSGYYHE